MSDQLLMSLAKFSENDVWRFRRLIEATGEGLA